VAALLDWIGTQPQLDPSRVMIYGGSYGGHMTYIPHIAGGIWRQFPRLTAPELGNQGSRGCSASISRSV
jgi:hypothetical protein